jgi:LemA protein
VSNTMEFVPVRRFPGRRWLGALVAAVVSVGLASCGVNSIPTKGEQARAQWGEVQNQYQRRAALIPNLVATVQGYANQERTTLVQVTQARASATQVRVDASTLTDPAAFQRYQAAQDQLSGVLGHLMSITENYPELRSNENFMALQSQLEGTENRIAIARRDYNEAVRVYNTELRTFPGTLWASTLYHNERAMVPFSASAAAQSAPTVNFNQPGSSTGTTPGSAGAPAPGAGSAAPPSASSIPMGGQAPEPAQR